MRLLKSKQVRLQLLISLAFASELLYLLIASVADLRDHLLLFLLSYGAIFTLYWLACSLFFLNGAEPTARSRMAQLLLRNRKQFAWLNDFLSRQRRTENLQTKELLTIGIVFGIFFRLTLLFSAPSLSDDIYRYVWDGKVAAHGINPYQYPPDAAELDSLRDAAIYPKINHKEIPTVYPPVTQLVFRGLFALDGSPLMFKLGFVAFDLLTIFILFFILKSLNIGPARLLIYVWNPLVIVEIAGSGHADIVGVFFLMVMSLLIVQRKIISGTFFLVLSFLTKLVSIVLLPVVMFLKRESKLVVPILFTILVALLYLPYADVGDKLFSGLAVYTAKWQNNSSVFALLTHGIQSILPEQWIIRFMLAPQNLTPTPEASETMGLDLALLLSKIIVVVIFGSLLLYFLIRLRKDMRRQGQVWFFKLALILFGAVMILNPTVHPWYLCWLAPLLAIVPNRAFLLFTGLVMLSYWTLNDYASTGIWRESVWIRYIEYVPFYVLLILEGVQHQLRVRTQTFGKIESEAMV